MGTRTFLVLVAILLVLLGANAHFAMGSIENKTLFWPFSLLGVIASSFLIFAAYANRHAVN